MSDGMLSQDEIDALLGAGANDVGKPAKESADMDVKAIGEILRQAMGATAEGIGIMTGKEGRADAGMIGVIPFNELQERLTARHVVVQSDLTGDVDGVLFTLFPWETAQMLGELAGAQVMDDATGLLPDVFGELFAEIAMHLSDAFTNGLGVRVDLDPTAPEEIQWQMADAPPLPFDPEEPVVYAESRLVVGETDFGVSHILPLDVAAWMVETASQGRSGSAAGGSAGEVAAARDVAAFSAGAAAVAAHEPVIQPDREPSEGPVRRTPQGAQIKEASFAPLGGKAQPSYGGNMDLLLDVPLQVTVELGRTRLQIREILELGKGSVVELDKLVGEPVEIYVNGKLLAKGEVVTIDENFGVKITDIVSRRERVTNLQ